MRFFLVPLIVTCGPAALSTAALLRAVREYRRAQFLTSPLWAVGCAWLVSIYPAYLFLRYTIEPTPYLPPWEDPEILGFASLILMGPIGLLSAFIAERRGASIWVVLPLTAASLVLTFVGFLATLSV